MKRLLPLFLSLCLIFLTGYDAATLPFPPKPDISEENLDHPENMNDLRTEIKVADIKLSKRQQKKLATKKAKLKKKIARKGINFEDFDSIEDILDEPFFRLGLICILASLLLGLLGSLLFGLGGVFIWLSGILAFVGIILLIIALLQVV